MNELMKAHQIIDKVKQAGYQLSIDEARQLSLYDSAAFDYAAGKLRAKKQKGEKVTSILGYLSKIASSPEAAARVKPAESRKPSLSPMGMPETYSLDSMPRLTAQEAYDEIAKIESVGNNGLEKLLGEELASQLRYNVCKNIAARIHEDVEF